MAKLLDLSGLTYYSNKIKEFINDNIKSLSDRIEEVSVQANSDIADLNSKVNINTGAIGNNSKDIEGLETKYEDLEDRLNNTSLECDGHPNGDIVNINGIEQYVFRNVNAGDVIEIPNTTGDTDYVIEVYADMAQGNVITHKTLDLNLSNADKLIYDPAYIEVTANGIKPRDTINLNYTSKEVVQSDGSDQYFEIFVSEEITEELITRIASVVSVEER